MVADVAAILAVDGRLVVSSIYAKAVIIASKRFIGRLSCKTAIDPRGRRSDPIDRRGMNLTESALRGAAPHKRSAERIVAVLC
jgi:hypothetical protein